MSKSADQSLIKTLTKIVCFFINFALLVSELSYAEVSNKEKDVGLLSPISIFQPLLADPKWPRFTLAYHYYTKGPFKSVFSPNFGAALPLVRWKSTNNLTYEIGLHAGLFAMMDIQSSPTRLINADYFIGPTLAIKNGQWDSLSRISHTSSHLGDEFLLSKEGKKIQRINLSYEVIEQIFAYNFLNGLKPFAGVGYIFHADPSYYKTMEFLAGFDYRHPEYYFYGYARPIFAVYSKTSNNFSWHPSLSIKGGLEFKDKFVIGKELQLLLEYYNGNSIQGQFYKTRESYVGASLSLNF